jgi:hypothetical protein
MEEASLPDQKKMPRKKRGIKRWWLGTELTRAEDADPTSVKGNQKLFF